MLGFRDAGPRVTLKVLGESADSLELEVNVAAAAAEVLERDDLDGGVSRRPMATRVTAPSATAARFKVVSR